MSRTTIPRAAVLLLFEVASDSIAEHDDWHTHEHMPERLRIPGFLRGTRWTSLNEAGHYCVLYELESVDVLDSDTYRTTSRARAQRYRRSHLLFPDRYPVVRSTRG